MSAARLYVGAVVLVLFFSGACGYRMARFDNPELEGINTIAIPFFENTTYEPGLDAIFTYAFSNKFIETKRLQLAGIDEADLVLHGTIKRVSYDALGMSEDRRSLQWRIWVTAQVTVTERETGRVLWKRASLRHSEEYRTTDVTEQQPGIKTDELQLDAAARQQAFRELAADMAEQAHDGLLQGF